MYKKILVPLDGSPLAECALPHVEQVALKGNESEVILVSVTELMKLGHVFYDPHSPSLDSVGDSAISGYAAPADVTGAYSAVEEAVGKMENQAQAYLERISGDLKEKGIKAKVKVLKGEPAHEIVSYAEDNGCDIIVMASHGRSGPTRWALGSISDKVFRSCCVPVLMVRGPGCALKK